MTERHARPLPPPLPVVNKRLYTRMMDRYRYGRFHTRLLNPVIRSAFALKVRFDMARVARARVARAQVNAVAAIDAWVAKHRPFFGFAVYRSGSTFLAHLLNQALERDIVLHEANVVDYWYYARALADPTDPARYVEDYRLKEILVRLRGLDYERYGEINPFLRRHAAAIRERLPGVPTFHLVRDPRAVLRSLMSRELLAPHDPMARRIRPPAGDPYRAKWLSMSRFERLCWMWASDTRFLLENTDATFRFEAIRSDYEQFSGLLKLVDLTVPEAVWRDGIDRVKNPTPRYRFPKFEGWSASDRAAFERICGAERAACGY